MTTNTHKLLDEFPQTDPWMTIVTRDPRPDDRPDSYRTVSREAFEAMAAEGKLYESDSTQNGEMYGKRLQDLTRALTTPGVLVFHINYVGFEKLAREYPNLVRAVWLDVSRETSKQRLCGRDGEPTDAVKLRKLNERLDKGDTEEKWLRESALPRQALGELPATILKVIDGEPEEVEVYHEVRGYFRQCMEEFGHVA